MKKIFTLLLLIFIVNTYSSAQQLEWEEIDVPIHSPVWDICFTPSGEIYAGSYGIYKSDDGGQNWEADEKFWNEKINPYYGNIFISSRGYIFAAYDNFFKTLRKVPGSPEWEKTDKEYAVSYHYILESSSGRLYCSNGDRLLYSDDNGDTWKERMFYNSFIYQFSFTITTDDKIVIFGWNFPAILLFEENADTLLHYDTYHYQLPDKAPFDNLYEIYTFNNTWIGATSLSSGDLYFSEDEGLSWTKIEEISNKNLIVSILPGQNNSILVFTIDEGVFHGDSTLQNWSHYPDQGLGDIMKVKYHKGKYYACSDRGVFQSTDEGKSWVQYVSGVAPITYDVYVKDDTTYVSTTGGIFMKSTLNEKWLKTNTEKPFNLSMRSLKFEHANGKLYTKRKGNIITYNPHLNLWEDVFEEDNNNISGFIKNIQGEIILVISGDEYKLLRLTETGTEIIDLEPEVYNLGMFYSNGLYLFTSMFSDESYYSLDNLETFHSTNFNAYLPHISDLCYLKDNIYLSQSGRILFSDDYGETWSERSKGIKEYMNETYGGNPSVDQILSIGNMLYATSEYGAFRSTDMAENWSAMTDVPVKCIFNMRHAEDNHLYVTSGRGLYRTTEEVVSVKENDLPKYNETSIIYPNPANDRITIEISDTFVPEKIEIVDLKGNKVYNKNIGVKAGGSTISLSIEDIPQGVYIIRLVNQVETRAQILNIFR